MGVIWGHSIYGFRLPLELNGAFWVWIFFVITGYLTGKGFSHERYGVTFLGYRRFILNRIIRIIPLYAIALIIGLFLEIVSNTYNTSVLSVIAQFTFLSSLNSIPLSGPLWAVNTIVHFYIVAIIIVWVILRINNKLIVFFWFGSLVIAALYIHFVGDNIEQPRTFVGNLHFFIFGLALSTGQYELSVRLTRSIKAGVIATLIAFAWFLNNWHPDYFWRLGLISQIFPGGGAYLLEAHPFVRCWSL